MTLRFASGHTPFQPRLGQNIVAYILKSRSLVLDLFFFGKKGDNTWPHTGILNSSFNHLPTDYIRDEYLKRSPSKYTHVYSIVSFGSPRQLSPKTLRFPLPSLPLICPLNNSKSNLSIGKHHYIRRCVNCNVIFQHNKERNNKITQLSGTVELLDIHVQIPAYQNINYLFVSNKDPRTLPPRVLTVIQTVKMKITIVRL